MEIRNKLNEVLNEIETLKKEVRYDNHMIHMDQQRKIFKLIDSIEPLFWVLNEKMNKEIYDIPFDIEKAVDEVRRRFAELGD